jgi:metal-responsive CopG/Arc/MetJ family transcriptional regulator
MRTTVTLQEDVARAVERLRRERGSGVSEVVNDLIRRGLAQPRTPPSRFRQRTSEMHARLDVTNVGEVLDNIDGPAAR